MAEHCTGVSVRLMNLPSLKTWIGTVYWQQALLGGPALLAVLALSLSWEPHVAVVTTASAFTIAFGAAHALPGRRWWPMIVTCLGMASATVLGSVAAEEAWALFALAGILTACCAALSAWNGDWWWVDLQVVCAFLVASYFPGSFDVGLERAVLVVTGGGAQIIFTLLTALLWPAFAAALPSPPLQVFQQQAQLRRYALTAAAAVVLSLALARGVSLHNDYWASIAALMVLRPGLHDTRTRYLRRLTGTLVGCVATMFIIGWALDATGWLVVFTALAASAAFSTQKAHYGLFTCLMSATIIFMQAIGHGDPLAATEHRIESTLLGGSVALVLGMLLSLTERFLENGAFGAYQGVFRPRGDD